MNIADFLTTIWDTHVDGFTRVRHLVDDTIYKEVTGYTLADIAAKRRIVELHSGGHECSPYDHHGDVDPCSYSHDFEVCSTLRLLALPFAAHADYDEAWRV